MSKTTIPSDLSNTRQMSHGKFKELTPAKILFPTADFLE
jgi:hypothetical protein